MTEFALSFGKVYLAQVVDFYSNEILAFSISRSPNMDQQEEMFDALVKALPLGASPILHSDMGWQYQNPDWIMAFSISRSPNMDQQEEMFDALVKALPLGASPILHSDMGWQYQNPDWIKWTKEHNVTRSMSRKGNCLDNAATEQAFGHMKDEFFKCWDGFDAFKSDLTAYIAHWNTKRPQERLDGYAPSEYRQRYVKAE